MSLRSNGDRAVAPSTPAKPAEQEKAAAVSPDVEARARRINPIKLKQMKERCHELEENIVRLEAEIALAETALQTFVSVEETQRQTDLLNRAKSELERSMGEWEELAASLESAEV
jgi:ATP-binding cassette subfamily F protein 3